MPTPGLFLKRPVPKKQRKRKFWKRKFFSPLHNTHLQLELQTTFLYIYTRFLFTPFPFAHHTPVRVFHTRGCTHVSIIVFLLNIENDESDDKNKNDDDDDEISPLNHPNEVRCRPSVMRRCCLCRKGRNPIGSPGENNNNNKMRKTIRAYRRVWGRKLKKKTHQTTKRQGQIQPRKESRKHEF